MAIELSSNEPNQLSNNVYVPIWFLHNTKISGGKQATEQSEEARQTIRWIGLLGFFFSFYFLPDEYEKSFPVLNAQRKESSDSAC